MLAPFFALAIILQYFDLHVQSIRLQNEKQQPHCTNCAVVNLISGLQFWLLSNVQYEEFISINWGCVPIKMNSNKIRRRTCSAGPDLRM